MGSCWLKNMEPSKKISSRRRKIFVEREEEVRAAGRLPIHFVRRDDEVGWLAPFLSNVQLLEEEV